MPFVCLLSVLVKVLINLSRRGSSSAAPCPQSPDTGHFWRWLSGKELLPPSPIRPHSVERNQTALHVVTFRNHLSLKHRSPWILLPDGLNNVQMQGGLHQSPLSPSSNFKPKWQLLCYQPARYGATWRRNKSLPIPYIYSVVVQETHGPEHVMLKYERLDNQSLQNYWNLSQSF